MHLWTEYEGRTIAEHYTLGKLLRSEGRNGFFATADKDGHPAVIRLTEAHFDEAELLNRWRHVAEVHQDNLIEIEQVGQTTFEGVALTYALMEPDDANLGDVLHERPLTTAETLQVAKSVLAALQALHARDLVHENIEPRNVLAVGETVKLRSDCVRECVVDGEFNTAEACAELRRKDIHDFGALLLRCLTLETEWSPAHNNLADPFKRIIPRALDGSWTLDQLAAPLGLTQTPATSKLDASSVPPQGNPSATEALTPRAVSQTSPSLPPTDASIPNRNPQGNPTRPLVPPGVRQTASTSNLAGSSVEPQQNLFAPADPTVPLRTRFTPDLPEPTHTPSKALWILVAAGALLVLLLGWHFFSASKTEPTPTGRPAPVVSSGAVDRPAGPAIPPTSNAPAASSPVTTVGTPATTHPGASGWYVIAFTYNHEGQAAEKAKRLRRTHDSLHPEVFTPSGHAPYLVSLGGPQASQEEAESIFRHARRAGLPRDTFVRHY